MHPPVLCRAEEGRWIVKLSVITINRNHAPGLKKTVESVVGQTFQDVEFIVIDGDSTDGSREVIEAHAGQIARWVSEPDGGIYAAMNKGLRVAKGEYVYFLNSGDWLSSADILDQIFARNKFKEDMLYGDSLRPDGSGGWRVFVQPDEWTVARFFGMGICHQTLFYKRELFDLLGGYDEQYRIIADWDFNFRALLAGRSTRHLSFPVVYYDGQGVSATRIDEMEAEKVVMRKRLLPAAVHRDYERLLVVEKECHRLQQVENWAKQIRVRNPLLNYAMATKWALEKWTGRSVCEKIGGTE